METIQVVKQIMEVKEGKTRVVIGEVCNARTGREEERRIKELRRRERRRRKKRKSRRMI